MAESGAVAEGIKAAETLQAEQKAKQELETLLARASKARGSGLAESEPEVRVIPLTDHWPMMPP